MERLSDIAIEIINELHTERLDYNSEYLPLIDAAQKLNDIETVMGDYDLDRLRELVQADREGRCVVLPVKEGDTVYRITWNPFEDDPPEIFDCAFHITDYYSIGRTVFLTEEEAEAALKAMKEREDDDRP